MFFASCFIDIGLGLKCKAARDREVSKKGSERLEKNVGVEINDITVGPILHNHNHNILSLKT